MKKLIKLSDYVLELYNQKEYGLWNFHNDVFKYTKFLQQKPQLGDFIPCKDGKPLENPLPDIKVTEFIESIGGISEYNKHPMKDLHREYQQALDRVKFKGFVNCKNGYMQRRTEMELQRIEFTDYGVVFYRFNLKGHYISHKEIKTYEDLTEYGLKLTKNK